MATTKQVNYALYLLQKNGYSVKYMDAGFKKLGASMRERSGKVEDWISSKNTAEASDLIQRLLEE